MRVFLTVGEMKLIRDALYQNRSGLEDGLKSKEPTNQKVREVIEDGIISVRKLILYFNDCIEREGE